MRSGRRWVRRVLVGLACAGLYGLVLFQSPQGIPTLMERWNEVKTLESQNAALAREIAAQKERIERLRESPSEQEYLIRKELKLLREGETSFILPEQPKPTPAGKQ